jgi:hypothetical protein
VFQFSIHWSQKLKIEPCYRFGTLIAHREDMSHLPKSKSFAFDLNYYFPHSDFKFDKFESGVTFTYGELGNEEVLGSLIGISTFYNLPILKSLNQEFSFRVGSGFGYISKIFNPEYNQKNTAVSSHLNALVDLTFNHSISISQKFNFCYGVTFKHLSNGATSVPNLGLNYTELKMGIGFNSSYLTKKNDLIVEESPVRMKNSIAFVGGRFFKQILDNYGVNYPVYYGTIFSQFGLKRNLSFELGLDAMYNTSLIHLFYTRKNQVVSNTDAFQIGAYVGGNAHINKLHVLIGMGNYVFDRYTLNGSFYHKLALRYKPISKLLFGVGIKSHWFNADYFEVVGGFIF